MRIRTHTDINGITAKWLRERAGLSQQAFWRSVSVAQPTGSQYETGSRPIPDGVRKLLFITYEAGVTHDTSTLQGADQLRSLGQMADQPHR